MRWGRQFKTEHRPVSRLPTTQATPPPRFEPIALLLRRASSKHHRLPPSHRRAHHELKVAGCLDDRSPPLRGLFPRGPHPTLLALCISSC